MDFTDNGTLVLRAETNEFDKKLTDLNTQAKTLKASLKEIETQSGKNNELYKKTKTELDNVRKAQEQLTKELKNMDTSKMTFQQLQNYVKALNKELKGMVPDSAAATAQLKKIGEAEAQLKKVTQQAQQIKNEAANLGQNTLWSKVSSGIKSVGTAFQAILALQVIQWFINIGKAIFDTTSTFEKYEKVLTTALGGQKQAKESMEAIKKMAKETSFGVDELTDGYVKMVNRGLRPSQKEMMALADLAASQGKTFDQLVEAVLDAQTGEFERLKEFGVKARKEGDNVSLSFKGQTMVVKNNERAIYDAMIAMGSMTGVAGQNAQMMQILGGKSSNLGDSMDALKVTIGDRLSPVFKFFLDAITTGIEWLVKVVTATDPVVQVFSDLFGMVGKLASSFINVFANVFPSFNAGGNALNYVMQAVAFAFRAALTPTQLFIGVLTVAFDTMAGIVQGGKAVVQVLSGDFTGAAKSFENAKKNFSNVGTHAAESFDKIKKGWTQAFVDQPQKDIPQAVFAAKTAEDQRQAAVSESQKKAAEKQQAQKVKAESKLNEMLAQLDSEHSQLTAANALESEEYKIQEKRRKRLKEIADSIADEKTKEAARAAVNRNADAEILALRQKDNKKALELLASLEAEHSVKTAVSALAAEEAKIAEIKRKRILDIENSAADESTKADLILAINRNAEASLDKVREEFRLKRIKDEQDSAQKRLAAENFIREQQKSAEMTLLDWQEQQAKGNADKIALIKKERVDTELRLTQDKLQAELFAEGQKAVSLIQNDEQLAVALSQIEERYHTASLMATAKAADDKIAIDKDLSEKKTANLKAYSDALGALLQGDVTGFLSAAQTMVKGHQDAWQQRLSADMGSYEQGAQMAQQAVSFLNDLAQRKADKAIEQANRERDEKVAILQNELSVTESLITSSSNFITALKEAEKNRLAELQQTLTSETASEEQKRDALHQFYSQQLQDMKAAEEQKIMDLQKLANQAKTEDEKRAIEEKIAMAKKESEEKIRLAEQEMEEKATMIDELAEFTAEINDQVLTDAQKASEKQVTMAEDEADKKATLKEDLEALIAAENQKARTKEAAEKKKAFQAQKKADIAAALITGALAILKALANFFPLNIVLAAVAAVATGVQIAKIKSQPEPSFAMGGTLGFVAQGSKHGSTYGTGGIALVDRKTQREVGEMEGDEAIISAKQTAANWPVIQQMFQNARTPGKTEAAVIPGTPLAFRDGGKFESPYWERGMYLFGSKKKKEAQKAAAAAEAEAAAAQAEADEAMGDVSFDGSAYGGVDGTDPATTGDAASAQAAHEEAQKQGKEQLKAIQDILTETKKNGELLGKVASSTGDLKGSVNGVESAVNSVRDAVNSANTHGRFDQLIGAISNLG
ncbi:hypothetical protein DYBT9275_00912 [Dyadobacter sp. CECT 9275]|uniref:Uncharacterized protein n=1 Tax=Dyadobacter helix TaxID=2822344 RepID=A0A916J8U8_9BACT|nr:hypothetical protein [Dyadobacter sp. CECT 9275]CAG4992195.1 hypothetical protein DYBT9275_00912 [Dyadobacter sp. CECT 9275]